MAGLTPVRVVGGALFIVAIVFSAAAQAKTCADEMVEIRSEIDGMRHDANKNVAEHQYGVAQERLQAGKEKSCLRYLEAARAMIDADQMHDN